MCVTELQLFNEGFPHWSQFNKHVHTTYRNDSAESVMYSTMIISSEHFNNGANLSHVGTRGGAVS